MLIFELVGVGFVALFLAALIGGSSDPVQE